MSEHLWLRAYQLDVRLKAMRKLLPHLRRKARIAHTPHLRECYRIIAQEHIQYMRWAKYQIRLLDNAYEAAA